MIEFTWDHLQLCSADVDATTAWFERCLGAEVVRRPGRVDLRLGPVNFFITPLTKEQIAMPPESGRLQGIDHFGVRVDDLDAAFDHLVRSGTEIVEPVRQIRAGVRACFVRAPGNILIEILERRADSMKPNLH